MLPKTVDGNPSFSMGAGRSGLLPKHLQWTYALGFSVYVVGKPQLLLVCRGCRVCYFWVGKPYYKPTLEISERYSAQPL